MIIQDCYQNIYGSLCHIRNERLAQVKSATSNGISAYHQRACEQYITHALYVPFILDNLVVYRYLHVAFMSCFLKKKHFNSLVSSSNRVRCVMIHHGNICGEMMDRESDYIFWMCQLTLACSCSMGNLCELGRLRVNTKLRSQGFISKAVWANVQFKELRH